MVANFASFLKTSDRDVRALETVSRLEFFAAAVYY